MKPALQSKGSDVTGTGAAGAGTGTGTGMCMVGRTGVVVGQPRRAWTQHHCFFGSDQAACQLLNAMLQSKGRLVGGAVGQPRLAFMQHQTFLPTDQPALQLSNPALQSYGNEVVAATEQPTCLLLQHQVFLPSDQPFCQFATPAWQSYLSPPPLHQPPVAVRSHHKSGPSKSNDRSPHRLSQTQRLLTGGAPPMDGAPTTSKVPFPLPTYL
mmetsp:Transcript_33912/g.66715  ORF Transcript_33912/g.66715 Transcript_33912/m.66715 type:complete len:211 (+) Transcript_33912:490-1122(+)